MTPASPTLPPTQARPRRRWWLRGLMLIALPIVAVAGLYSYVTISSRLSLAEAEAEADRSDPDWRLEAVQAKRKVLADDENSALHLIAVARLGGSREVEDAPNYEGIFAGLTPQARLNQQQEQLVRTQLARLTNALEGARKLQDMPYGRNPVQYSPDYYETLYPWGDFVRVASDWLEHDAWLLVHDENTDSAIQSCHAMMNVARTLGDEPSTLIQLMRRNNQRRSLVTLERVLAQGEASDAPLERLQGLIALEISESTWKNGIRGSRAGLNRLFDGVRAGRLPSSSLRPVVSGRTGSSKLTEWIHHQMPSSLLRYYPEFLRLQNRLVEVSQLPTHEQARALAEIEAAIQAAGNPVVDDLLGEINMARHDCASQALLRSTFVAIACERYRLRFERWPDALSDLVQAKYLDAIPLDPYDGQILRYRRVKDGVVIYALGSDLTDNDGRIDRDQHHSVIGLDQGFRLWDRDKRRQAPLPVIDLPEGQ